MISEQAKKRYESFWANDAIDRCCMYVIAPSPNAQPYPDPDESIDSWENLDFRVDYEMHRINNTLFFADAYPTVFTNFGPGSLAACIGGTYKWAKDTVWFENEPFITDWDNLPELRLDKNSKMYNLVEQFTSKLIKAGKNKFFTSASDSGGTLDIVAALRGTQDLLMELYEYPEQIKELISKLQPIMRDYSLGYANRLVEEQSGMTTWMQIYSSIAYAVLQCDFSAMISPDMFAEFVLPDLIYQSEYWPRCIYHWDGPGELVHLDHLLSIPRLNAIQWTPGTGNEDVTHERWYEYYHRIQRAGKGLVLLDVTLDNMEVLLKNISTKGLFMYYNAKDAKEAQEFVDLAASFGVK